VACRTSAGWSVAMAVAEPVAESPGYRPASTAWAAPFEAAIDTMMATGPLDRAAEAAAQARGWRH
ncbi:MAG: anti-sigma factor, partial [Alphaproteobacteria bacterium]